MPEKQEDGSSITWTSVEKFRVFERTVLDHFAQYLSYDEFRGVARAISETPGGMRSLYRSFATGNPVDIYLISMFAWSSTPEGLRFWQDVHKRTPGVRLDPINVASIVLDESAER